MTVATYEPLIRFQGLEHLDLLDSEQVFDRDRLHEGVQTILQRLDEPVGKALPNVRVIDGQTRATSQTSWLQLFSYRTYALPDDSNIDPVVVGIYFGRSAKGMVLRGDICGDTLGDILFELPPQEHVENEPILKAAQEVAEKLSRQSNRIIAALKASERSV